MYVYSSRTLIEIWSPAKLNLFLEVLGERTDGFREIETLMVPIGIYDTVTASKNSDGAIQFSCRWAPGLLTGEYSAHLGFEELPVDEQNLVVRAFRLLKQEFDVGDGANVALIKRIPSQAGLGGGSGNAAAALVAANELWELQLSVDQLMRFAAQLGSDVPFFLAGRSCVCRGRGEIVEPINEGRTPLQFVVVRPPVGLSTAEVYRHTASEKTERRSVQRIASDWQYTSVSRVASNMFNRLQLAAHRMSPWVDRIASTFEQLDVLGHQMTGSGSCYFAICRNHQHARTIAGRLRGMRLGHVFATSSLTSSYFRRSSVPSQN